MSKLKTPREKKFASLVMDSRVVHAGNDKARRVGMPRAKQLGKKAVRRAASELLHSVASATPEDEVVALETATKSREFEARHEEFRRSFKNAKLGSVLDYKRSGDQHDLRWSGR